MIKKIIILSFLASFTLLFISCNQNAKQTADQLYERAKFYEFQGNDKMAIEKMEKALERDPENIRIMYRLGSLYKKRGMLKKSEDTYSRIIDLNSDEYRAYILIGNLNYYQERYSEAIEYWKKAVEINPDLKKENAPYYNNIGMNVIQKPHYFIEGEKFQEKGGANKVDPTMARVYGVMGEMYYNRGLYEKAIETWNKVIEMSPGSYEAQQAEVNIAEAEKKIKQ